MSSTVIEIKNIRKTYGKGEFIFEALKGINLSIAEGEVVAITGKSGSGKSTLLHLMALLDKPTDGEIKINNKAVKNLTRNEMDLLRNNEFGFVFQQFFLNANDSVLNNVILPLKINGIGSKERNQRGIAALKSVELEDKATSKSKDLSGGQKQRVAIARAIINNPTVIFADEPTGNLDTVTGEKIESLLFDLNHTHNITLIFVTHDPDLAKRCDRVIEIKDGAIIREKRKK